MALAEQMNTQLTADAACASKDQNLQRRGRRSSTGSLCVLVKQCIQSWVVFGADPTPLEQQSTSLRIVVSTARTAVEHRSEKV